jgi:hypothetical protein
VRYGPQEIHSLCTTYALQADAGCVISSRGLCGALKPSLSYSKGHPKVSSNVDPIAGSELDLVDDISQRMRRSRALPVGTERYFVSGKSKGTVLVKVSDQGKQSERWRPKQQVIWERATGQKVPPGCRVIFKDGDKENFDAANLELATPGEIFAHSIARFLANPPSLRKVIRLNRQLERELWRQINNCSAPPATKTTVRRSRRGVSMRRWTPQMVDMLRRHYPTQPIPELAAAIGVSISQVRQAARRFGVRRMPEAMVAHATAAARIVKQRP